MNWTHTKASEVKTGDVIEMVNPETSMKWTVVANNKSNNSRQPVAITFTTAKGNEFTLNYGYTAKFWVESN